MSKLTFEWSPDLGASKATKSTVQATKFGDGYELRLASHINFTPCKWSVTFTRNASEIAPILEFLEARGGLESFYWKDPLDKTAIYVCREWDSEQQNQGLYKVTADFEQVFEY